MGRLKPLRLQEEHANNRATMAANRTKNFAIGIVLLAPLGAEIWGMMTHWMDVLPADTDNQVLQVPLSAKWTADSRPQIQVIQVQDRHADHRSIWGPTSNETKTNAGLHHLRIVAWYDEFG